MSWQDDLPPSRSGPMLLANKIALVTGGTGTIGRAICRALASSGATVCFTYMRSKERAKGLKETLPAPAQQRHEVINMDVTRRASVKEGMRHIESLFGKIDILVNNAGINNPNDFDIITDKEWDRILEVNLKGPFIVTQEAIYLLAPGASIINIGSVSGQYGGPRTAHYAASKAGLISLGQVMARFFAPKNIRVNTISAGLIQSDMAKGSLSSPSVKKQSESILLKRLGTPEEVAEVVVFLASTMSSYITAQTINVNGGLYF